MRPWGFSRAARRAAVAGAGLADPGGETPPGLLQGAQDALLGPAASPEAQQHVFELAPDPVDLRRGVAQAAQRVVGVPAHHTGCGRGHHAPAVHLLDGPAAKTTCICRWSFHDVLLAPSQRGRHLVTGT